jgi:hypothetical protein
MHQNLNKFIQEVIKEELNRMLEDTEGFSLEQLKTCPTPASAKQYLDSHLEKVGEGHFRITYGLDEKTVIKIIKPDSEDIMQNAQEARNSRCLPKRYVVQVLDKHPEFWWIVMERLQGLSREQFVAEFEKRIGSPVPYKPDGRGYDLEQKESKIMMAIEFGAEPAYANVQGERKTLNDQWLQNKWYAGLIAALRKCQVQSDDFHYKNWGIRPGTGELVLLDLGF